MLSALYAIARMSVLPSVCHTQGLNWAAEPDEAQLPPMISAPPPVVGAPLHPNKAPVPSCILNDWCYY